MPGARKRCAVCTRQYRVPLGAPDEDRCASCRGEAPKVGRPRQRSTVVELPRPGAGRGGPAAAQSPGGHPGLGKMGKLEQVTLAELERAGRHEHPLGVLLLQLAHDLDRSVGATRQRLAAEFRKARVDALEGTAPDADVLDLVFADEDAASS